MKNDAPKTSGFNILSSLPKVTVSTNSVIVTAALGVTAAVGYYCYQSGFGSKALKAIKDTVCPSKAKAETAINPVEGDEAAATAAAAASSTNPNPNPNPNPKLTK